MRSHSVTCHPTEVILTSLPPAYFRYSFIDPGKVAGYAKMVYPETVTHPSNNQAQRRVTPLIGMNVAACVISYISCNTSSV